MPSLVSLPENPLLIDLGCGPCKKPGAFGIDWHPFPGVDLVHNLDSGPIPLPDSCASGIYCNHVIEHVADPVTMIAEMHRLCRDGALVRINTPHFSSLDSWSDMTHVRHLSTVWPSPFLENGYLAPRTGAFQLVSSDVSFPRSLHGWLPRLIVALFGMRRWEKYYAFRYPAGEIHTVLRVVKKPTA